AFPFLPLFLHQDLHIPAGPQLAFWTGITGGATGLALAFTAPIWGRLADRYGRKPMLVRAMVGGGVSVGLMGLSQSALQLTVLREAAPRTMDVLRAAAPGTVGALGVLIAAQGLQQTSYAAAQQLVVLRLLQLTGAGDAKPLTGITFAVAGIATALASLTYSRLLRRTSYRAVITSGAVLMGLALFGTGITPSPVLVIAAFVIGSFFSGALIPSFGAMIGLEAPSIVQATVFGFSSSSVSLGFGLGPLLGGSVASSAGVQVGLITAGALGLRLPVLVGIASREPMPAQRLV